MRSRCRPNPCNRTNTHGLKPTALLPFFVQTSKPLRSSDDHVKMAVPSPAGDVKTVGSSITILKFCKYIDTWVKLVPYHKLTLIKARTLS